MITIGEQTIKDWTVGSSNISRVDVEGTLVWPQDDDYTYKLRNLTVMYNDLTYALHPNCGNYAYITAILVKKLGDRIITDNQSVILTPVLQNDAPIPKIDGKPLYVIDYDPVNVGYPIIRANENLKTTEYNYDSGTHTDILRNFTGTYKIGDKTIGGNTASDWNGGNVETSFVRILENKKTVYSQKKETTGVTLSRFTDYVSGSGGSISVPDCERVYTLTTQKTVWTSGVSEGGVVTPNQTEELTLSMYPNNQSPISISPANSGASVSQTSDGLKIDVTKNQSTGVRTWTVQVIYYDNMALESDPFYSNTVTLTQNANSYAYSGISNIEIIYPTIPASGGSVIPSSVSFTQTYGWKPDTSGLGNVSASDATITYYISDERIHFPSTSTDHTGTVSANSLGTDERTSTSVVKYVKAEISSHGQNGTSGIIAVEQAKNIIESSSSVVSIKISGVERTEYTVGPQSAQYSYTPSAVRSNTWSSGAPSTQNITSGFTVEKGNFISSATTSSFKITENDGSARDTFIKVSDSTYGSKTLTIHQEAVSYEFSEETSNPYTIEWTTTSFTISVYSSKNGNWFDIGTSNISFQNNGFSNLSLTKIERSITEDNVYVASFTCDQNSTTSDNGNRTVDIKFTQPTSGKTITYSVTQQHKIGVVLTTNVDNIELDNAYNSSASFTLSTNYSWTIDSSRYCTLNDPDNKNDDGDTYITVNPSYGSAGNNQTIYISRPTTVHDDYIVCDIKITANGEKTVHVIVIPPLTLTGIGTWKPGYTSQSTQAITTTYPTNYISWSSSDSSWLTGNEDYISVTANNGSSKRTGTITATGTINERYFTVECYKSKSVSIDVEQGFNSSPKFVSIKYKNSELSSYTTITQDNTLIRTWDYDTIGKSNATTIEVTASGNTSSLRCVLTGENLQMSTSSLNMVSDDITITSFTTSGSDKVTTFNVYPARTNQSSSINELTLTLTLTSSSNETSVFHIKLRQDADPNGGGYTT